MVDVALEVAIQAASGEDINLGAAAKGAALGVLDPTKTARKVAKLAKLANNAKKSKTASRAGGAGKTCCFVAGTLVETEEGLRPIEGIEVGDMVLSRDEKTGETTLKTVTNLIRNFDRVIWEVNLTGVDGATELLEASEDHPWWVAGKGWLPTNQLTAGMAVVTADGKGMVVNSVFNTNIIHPTFNLTVAEFNTFFVGRNSIWVHNAKGECDVTGGGGGGNSDAQSTRQKYIDKGVPESELGSSGKPKYHNSDSSTRKKALDGAKNDPAGSGKTVTDKATRKQARHHHSVKQNGDRVSGANKTHYNKRGDKPKVSD